MNSDGVTTKAGIRTEAETMIGNVATPESAPDTEKRDSFKSESRYVEGMPWFKVVARIYEDPKMLYIETLPDWQAIQNIWTRLLALAAQCNDRGYVHITPQVPYGDVGLARVLHADVSTLRLALNEFVKLEMIRLCDDRRILLVNFEKHQDEWFSTRHRRQLGAVRTSKHRDKNKANNRLTNQGAALPMPIDSGARSSPIATTAAPVDPEHSACRELASLSSRLGAAFDALQATDKFSSLELEHLAIVENEFPHARISENFSEIVTEARGVAGTVGSVMPWLRKAVSGLEVRVLKRQQETGGSAKGDTF